MYSVRDNNMWQIFSPGIIIGWTAEQEMRFFFQNVWTEGTVFIHKAVTQKAFVNTEVIYSKPQSNKSVPELFDGYGVKIYVSNWWTDLNEK